MMSYRGPRSVLLAIMILGIPLPAMAADDIRDFGEACRPILVPDELSTKHKGDLNQSLHDAACGEWYSAHKDQVNASGGLDVFGLFSASGGGGSSSSESGRQAYCNDHDARLASSLIDTFFLRVFSDARQRFYDCMALYQKQYPSPLVVSAPTASRTDSDDFVATIRWDANADPIQPKFLSFSNVDLVCNSDVLKKQTRIPRHEVAFNCHWLNHGTVGAVEVQSTRGTGLGLLQRTFPAVGVAVLQLTNVTRGVIATVSKCFQSQTSGDHHNEGYHDGCACDGDCKFCAQRMVWTISAASDFGSDWKVRDPSLHCERDNLSSCNWNSLGAFQTLQNDGATIRIAKNMGSRSIDVSICATGDQYGDIPTSAQSQSWSLEDGKTFVAEVPTGSTGVIRIKRGDSESAISAGDSDPNLALVRKISTPLSTLYTYQVPSRWAGKLKVAGGAKHSK